MASAMAIDVAMLTHVVTAMLVLCWGYTRRHGNDSNSDVLLSTSPTVDPHLSLSSPRTLACTEPLHEAHTPSNPGAQHSRP